MRRFPIDQLTDAQKVSLRLVYEHHNSKEIAAKQGVSPSAIDKRIERAVQMLGVTSRFEAARLLHDQETGTQAAGARTYDRLPSEPIDVPNDGKPAPFVRSEEPWGHFRRFLGLSGGGSMGVARLRSTRTERLVRLIVLTVLLAITFVVIVSLLLTVTTLLRANRDRSSPTLVQSKRAPK